jgi:DNA invertase Pin-like site-specific DNA recombinase
MAIVGYARVSSVGQSLDIQIGKLSHCDKIFQEKRSGVDNTRSELARALEYVREGDTFVVTKLDRLARSTRHLCEIAELLEQKRVALIVIDQLIDTSSPTGRLLFNVLASIAQFETEIRKERQQEGIDKALANGVKFGRTAALSPEQILELRRKRDEKVLIKVLMKEFGLSKASIYRYLSDKT